MVAWLVVVISSAGLLGCAAGWVGAIVGPKSLFALGVAGFGCGLVAHLLSRRARADGPIPVPPRVIRLVRWARILAGGMALLSLVALFCSSCGSGVADVPALEARATYALNNHGHHEAVSRARYVLVSASFSTGWLSLAALANLDAIAFLARSRSRWWWLLDRPATRGD